MKEKVIIAALNNYEDNKDFESSLKEIERLAESVGAEVCGTLVQNNMKIDSKTYIGKGKAEELKEASENLNVDTIIFNNELTGSQQKNLEKIIKKNIIDRTQLILEIFANRAHTPISKMQVELAKAKYMLPRLKGSFQSFDRQGGGIGTRGGGETLMETDRRHILLRINYLKDRLQKDEVTRDNKRRNRNRTDKKVVSLFGYTNAGKSTIMNKMIESSSQREDKKVYSDDLLFATLDTSLREVVSPSGYEFILSDTVGIIEDIPIGLVESFKSTLEELKYSDLILIVLDTSSENAQRQIHAINDLIEKLDLREIKKLEVYNKIDLLEDDYLISDAGLSDNKIRISARKDEDIKKLFEKIEELLTEDLVSTDFFIDYKEQKIISELLDLASNKKVEKKDTGLLIHADLEKYYYERFKKYECK